MASNYRESLLAVLPIALGSVQALTAPSPDATVCATILGGTVAGAVGFWTNRLASRADQNDRARPPTFVEIGLNHHLVHLAAQALSTVIAEYAATLPPEDKAGRALLQKASERAPDCWRAVIDSPSAGPLKTLDGHALADAVARHVATPGKARILSDAEWTPFSRFVLTEAGAPAPAPKLVEHLAARCAADFARHFHEHAKLSAEKNPASLAALLLQFLGEIRLEQQRRTKSLATLQADLVRLAERLEVAADKIVGTPGFEWPRLALELAGFREAHEQFREYFRRHQQDWNTLLPLVEDTLRLVRDIAQGQGIQLALARENLSLLDQVSRLVRELQTSRAEPQTGVLEILAYLSQQRASDDAARRQYDEFVKKRTLAVERGGHRYSQPADWRIGPDTKKYREPGRIFVARPPLKKAEDVPPPGTNLYLHGESGHGKSVLAANIADNLRRQGYAVLFFNLRQAGDVVRHLSALTAPSWLGLECPSELDEAAWQESTHRFIAACAWLLHLPPVEDKYHPPFCLVWDNADDRLTLEFLLGLDLLHHRGVQIITSRIPSDALQFPEHHPCRDWPVRAVEVVPIGPFSLAEARDYLRQACEGRLLDEEEEHRLFLNCSAPGHPEGVDPLALGQAVKLLKRQGWDFARAFPPPPPVPETGLLPVDDTPVIPLEPDHARILAATLATLSPLTRAVWQLLAHLAPAPLPANLWEYLAGLFTDDTTLSEAERADLRPELRDAQPIIQVRAALASAGLLTGESEGVSLHARNLALTRELVPPENRPTLYRRTVRLLNAVLPAQDPHDRIETWPWYRQAEPHIFAALGPERAPHLLDLAETNWLTYRFNIFLLAQDRPVEAEPVAQLNLRTALAHHGNDHPSTATSLHELARSHLRLGHLSDAESGFKSALALFRKHHGDDHPFTAAALQELARTHLGLGRLSDAESGFQSALVTKRKHFGDGHPSTATALQALAATHLALGRLSDAESGFQTALALFRKHRGDDHPSTATILHELARTHLELGRLSDAEFGFQQTLAIESKHYGAASWQAAVTRTHLARLAARRSGHAAAETSFAEARRDLERAGPARATYLAGCLYRWVESRLDHLEQVPSPASAPTFSPPTAELIQLALGLRTERLGTVHYETARTRLLLARHLRHDGDLASSRREAGAALAILSPVLGDAHPDSLLAAKLAAPDSAGP